MKQVIVVRKDLKLTKGKMSVQVAHASLEAYRIAEKKYPDKVKKWLRTGAKKVVVGVKDEEELIKIQKSIPRKIPSKLIIDAGKTHLEPGTKTCIGIGPFDDEEIDKITGNLKLIN